MYEIVDPKLCPNQNYFEGETYTWGWMCANVAFYLVFCDTWFYWWHYFFHVSQALWPMHFQHHQLREPTSFGGPTVHVIELIFEYTIAHHLVQYLMPFHPHMHRALGVFAFTFGAVFNHGGLTLDYNNHFAHHVTWKGGRGRYCNYGLFFPFWDMANGTLYDACAPPASAAKPKDKFTPPSA
jgi:sterol desaturase/sphingolipid hydroxylase (fatty acid hydroxylase superfamily)